jgi:hypothetical protein
MLKRSPGNLAALLVSIVALAGCGAAGTSTVPTQTGGNPAADQAGAVPTTQPTGTATMGTQTYPKAGHAPDYSWIAGRVTFTKIQGGCVYILTGPDATQVDTGSGETTPSEGGTAGTPIVGTAVAHDTSPPLRDITPAPPAAGPPNVQSDRFVPGGTGWDPSAVQDGDFVVAFGHPAGPGEPYEMCPGGRPYVIDKVMRNP